MSDSPVDPAAGNEHEGFCVGMRAVYDTLVRAGYVSADEIVWPEQQTEVHHRLFSSGPLSPAMVQILKQIPLPSFEADQQLSSEHSYRLNNSLGISIAPTTGALCYLDKEQLADCRYEIQEGVDKPLPEQTFKITIFGKQEGYLFLYDIQKKTVIEWSFDDHVDVLEELPQGPAAEVIGTWILNFRNLIWLPWRFETARYIDSRPSLYDQYRLDGPDNLTVECTELAKAELDEYEARRRIYVDCGWPDAFDLPRFTAAQRAWNQEYRDICEEAEDDDLDRLVTDHVNLNDNPGLIDFVARTARGYVS